MFRILSCTNTVIPYRTVPQRLLKCPNANPTLIRCYSKPGGKKSGHPILYTLGFTTLTIGGVVAYAKFDTNFRQWLEENLPGSDKFIEVVTEEKGVSVADVVVNKYEAVKNDTLGKIEDLTGFKFDSSTATPSVQPSSLSSSAPTNIKLPETNPKKLEENKIVEQPPVVVKEKVPDKNQEKPITKSSSPSKETKVTDLKSFADLEKKIQASAKFALESFNNGVNLLSKYDNKVFQYIDEHIGSSNEGTVLNELKKFKDEVNSSIVQIHLNANDALKSIENLKAHVNDVKFQATPEQINFLRQNINTVLAQVEKAKFDFESKKKQNNITGKYLRRIEEEKKKHREELEILFPNLDSYDKDPGLKNLNLLVLYASNKIQYYQKELAKLEMQYVKHIEGGKLRSGDDKQHIEDLVNLEVNKERRHLTEEFQKKALELQASFEKDIRTQLKRQAEAHSDHLSEALQLKQSDVDNKSKRDFETKLLEEKLKYKQQVATMIGRMKAFEDAFKKRVHTEAAVQHSQALWTASQALVLRIKKSISPEHVKPLKDEVEAIKKSAAQTDTFVQTICSAFPSEALNKGVYSEQALRERFLDVQDVAYRVALVPENGGSLPLVFLSYLQSLFIIRNVVAISSEEIRDEPTSKLNHLNTYEILERARYFVDRSDLLQAVKYLNLLEGGAKAVSQQWIKDAIVFLETDSAANALLSHAASVSFIN